jgi:hypothetical protein
MQRVLARVCAREGVPTSGAEADVIATRLIRGFQAGIQDEDALANAATPHGERVSTVAAVAAAMRRRNLS